VPAVGRQEEVGHRWRDQGKAGIERRGARPGVRSPAARAVTRSVATISSNGVVALQRVLHGERPVGAAAPLVLDWT
jgi:hypothetical protein